MCRIVKIERDAVPENITIEFERDASLRATEVLLINKGSKGEYGIKLICYDNGKISGGVSITDELDII